MTVRGGSEEEGPGEGLREQGDLLAGVEEAHPSASGDPRAGDESREPDQEPEPDAEDPAAVADADHEAPFPAPPGGPGPARESERDDDAPGGVRRKGVLFELVAEGGAEVSSPPPAGERLARARELVRAGRVGEALAVYRRILDENPGSLKARNNLGVLHDELGQHELALEQFEAAEKLGPDNVEVLVNLGSTLGVVARYEEAEAALRKAVRLEPESVSVRAALGILHFRRGVYAIAESELRWVCEQDHDHADAFYYRGEALNRLGRFDEALEALERAIALEPGNSRAFYTLGHLYDRKHLPEEAALMYRRARELQRR